MPCRDQNAQRRHGTGKAGDNIEQGKLAALCRLLAGCGAETREGRRQDLGEGPLGLERNDGSKGRAEHAARSSLRESHRGPVIGDNLHRTPQHHDHHGR